MFVDEQNDTEPNPKPDEEGHPSGSYSPEERFARAVRGLERPKPGSLPPHFHGISSDEFRERLLKVRACVHLRFSVEQMVDFLPTWGLKLSLSQVYEYLGRLKLPRGYQRSERYQDPHDFFCRRVIIRLAQDSPVPLQEIEINHPPFLGARFRPDGKFTAGKLLFFDEIQLEPLPEARWTAKHRNYVKLYEQLGRPFRVLFLVKEGDLTRIRKDARRVLKATAHPNLDLFRYAKLKDLNDSSANFMTGDVWLAAWSAKEKFALLR